MGGEWRDKPRRSPMDTGGSSDGGSKKMNMLALLLLVGSIAFVLTPPIWIALH